MFVCCRAATSRKFHFANTCVKIQAYSAIVYCGSSFKRSVAVHCSKIPKESSPCECCCQASFLALYWPSPLTVVRFVGMPIGQSNTSSLSLSPTIYLRLLPFYFLPCFFSGAAQKQDIKRQPVHALIQIQACARNVLASEIPRLQCILTGWGQRYPHSIQGLEVQ